MRPDATVLPQDPDVPATDIDWDGKKSQRLDLDDLMIPTSDLLLVLSHEELVARVRALEGERDLYQYMVRQLLALLNASGRRSEAR